MIKQCLELQKFFIEKILQFFWKPTCQRIVVSTFENKSPNVRFGFQRNNQILEETRAPAPAAYEFTKRMYIYTRLDSSFLRVAPTAWRARSWLWPQAGERERDEGARDRWREERIIMYVRTGIHRETSASMGSCISALCCSCERASERVGGIATWAEPGRAPLVARGDWSTTVCLYLLW